MEPSYTVGRNVSWYDHYEELQYGDTVKKKRKKLNRELQYNSSTPLLGTYPEKNIIQIDTCTPSVHCNTIYNSQDMEAT